LRIVKQLVAIFLAAQPGFGVVDRDPLRGFVRRRDDPLPAGSPRIYLYYNASPNGRVVPWCSMWQHARHVPPVGFSEISFPPLGVVFASDPSPFFEGMADVSSWGVRRYHDRADIDLFLPTLRVETDWPLGFGTAADVERWKKDAGVIWAVAEADDPASLTSVSATWRRAAS
jgi:hypothetical protein